MDRTSVILRLILCLSLLAAGLPSHACMDSSETENPAHIDAAVAVDHDRCPHHAPPAAETEPADPAPEGGADCCGLNCQCGCSAPLPALVLLTVQGTEPAKGQTVVLAGVLEPSLPLDRLLRPPKTVS